VIHGDHRVAVIVCAITGYFQTALHHSTLSPPSSWKPQLDGLECAVLVITLFSSDAISVTHLYTAIALLARLITVNHLGIRHRVVYIVVGGMGHAGFGCARHDGQCSRGHDRTRASDTQSVRFCAVKAAIAR
jgi:hypothetical protein